MKDAIRRYLLEVGGTSWKDLFIFAFIYEGGWMLWRSEPFNPFDVLVMTSAGVLIAWALRVSLARTIAKNPVAASNPRS